MRPKHNEKRMEKHSGYVILFIMKHILFIVLISLLWGCSHRSVVDKHLNHSGKVMDVKGLVKEIVIDSPFVGRLASPYVMDKYFILTDPQSEKNQILFFDKENFSYITGMGLPGEGPNEITSLGKLILDEKLRCLYVADYGKMQMSGYDLDSILLNPNCLPKYKFDLNKTTTPVMFSYVNDTLCYACCITAKPGEIFQEHLVTWNMQTGDMHPLISGHPDIERKRFHYAASIDNNLIAMSYDHHDLLATYDLQGNLKHYIYGPNWNDATSNAMIYYYGSIIICNNRIIVGYFGKRNPDVGEVHVTNLIVYDLDGNYIKTLKVGYNIVLFCYDSEYNRIIMALDDDIQFAYLKLDGLLE